MSSSFRPITYHTFSTSSLYAPDPDPDFSPRLSATEEQLSFPEENDPPLFPSTSTSSDPAFSFTQLAAAGKLPLCNNDTLEPELVSLSHHEDALQQEDALIENLYSKLSEDTLNEVDILSLIHTSTNITVEPITSSSLFPSVYNMFRLQAREDATILVHDFVAAFTEKGEKEKEKENEKEIQLIPRAKSTPILAHPSQLPFLSDHPDELSLQLPIYKVQVNHPAYPYPLAEGVLINAQVIPNIARVLAINDISKEILNFFYFHRGHSDPNHLFFPYRFFSLMKQWKEINHSVPQSIRVDWRAIARLATRSLPPGETTEKKAPL